MRHRPPKKGELYGPSSTSYYGAPLPSGLDVLAGAALQAAPLQQDYSSGAGAHNIVQSGMAAPDQDPWQQQPVASSQSYFSDSNIPAYQPPHESWSGVAAPNQDPCQQQPVASSQSYSSDSNIPAYQPPQGVAAPNQDPCQQQPVASSQSYSSDSNIPAYQPPYGPWSGMAAPNQDPWQQQPIASSQSYSSDSNIPPYQQPYEPWASSGPVTAPPAPRLAHVSNPTGPSTDSNTSWHAQAATPPSYPPSMATYGASASFNASSVSAVGLSSTFSGSNFSGGGASSSTGMFRFGQTPVSQAAAPAREMFNFTFAAAQGINVPSFTQPSGPSVAAYDADMDIDVDYTVMNSNADSASTSALGLSQTGAGGVLSQAPALSNSVPLPSSTALTWTTPMSTDTNDHSWNLQAQGLTVSSAVPIPAQADTASTTYIPPPTTTSSTAWLANHQVSAQEITVASSYSASVNVDETVKEVDTTKHGLANQDGSEVSAKRRRLSSDAAEPSNVPLWMPDLSPTTSTQPAATSLSPETPTTYGSSLLSRIGPKLADAELPLYANGTSPSTAGVALASAESTSVPSLLSRIQPRTPFALFAATPYQPTEPKSKRQKTVTFNEAPATVAVIPPAFIAIPESVPQVSSTAVGISEPVTPAVAPPIEGVAPPAVEAVAPPFDAVTLSSLPHTSSETTSGGLATADSTGRAFNMASAQPHQHVTRDVFVPAPRKPFTKPDGTPMNVFFCPLSKDTKQLHNEASRWGGVVTLCVDAADIAFYSAENGLYGPARVAAIQKGIPILPASWMRDNHWRWDAYDPDWYTDLKKSAIAQQEPSRSRSGVSTVTEAAQSTTSVKICGKAKAGALVRKSYGYQPYRVPSREVLLARQIRQPGRLARMGKVSRATRHAPQQGPEVMPGSFRQLLPWDECPVLPPSPPPLKPTIGRFVRLGAQQPQSPWPTSSLALLKSQSLKRSWSVSEPSETGFETLSYPEPKRRKVQVHFAPSPPTASRSSFAGMSNIPSKDPRCGSSGNSLSENHHVRQYRSAKHNAWSTGTAGQKLASNPIAALIDFVFSFFGPLVTPNPPRFSS